jgi:outer membrane protein assembly factor BamB
MDEELRNLERAMRAAPSDGDAARRYGAALARAGKLGDAATALEGALEPTSWDAGVLADLDALTRGGVDPTSPWPGRWGDGRRSRRSRCVGPARGEIVSRTKIRDARLADAPWYMPFVVDGSGRAIACAEGGTALVSIDPGGGVETVRAFEPVEPPWTRNGADVLLISPGRSAIIEVFDGLPDDPVFGQVHRVTIDGCELGEPGRAIPPQHWIAGLASFFRVSNVGGETMLDAVSLSTGRRRWRAKLDGPEHTALAVGPGASLLAISRTDDSATLERFDIGAGELRSRATIASRAERELVSLSGGLVVGSDGTAYVTFGNEVFSIDGDGETVWWRELDPRFAGVSLLGTAGEGSRVLVCTAYADAPGLRLERRLVGLDLSDGRELWRIDQENMPQLSPIFDAEGRIFRLRQAGLDVLDPATGRIVRQTPLDPPGWWRFSPGGDGRMLAIRSPPLYGEPEILVIE